MKIDALTHQGQNLVNAINKAIKDDELHTWKTVKNSEGEILYSHSPEQWDEKVLLKPSVSNDRVSFSVTWWNKNPAPDDATKGYVLGRCVEALMVHFKSYFSSLEVRK